MPKEELIGFKTLETHDIKCGDCGNKLANIEIIENNESRINRGKKPQILQYKINGCLKCRGSSFWSNFYEGTVIIGPMSDDYILENTDVSDEGGVIKVEFNVKRKK